MLSKHQIETMIQLLLRKYHADHAILFGSYARGDATAQSDLDVVVFGGDGFKKSNIFAFAEDLRELTGKNVDAFEICEVNKDSAFYDSVMREGVRIA
ncbi:MAG: nucleotidyltransferase domain-containing protein [Clostridia bacterium]|nr:nucleotidyltransferase domain-containing protein [Clostridia bacterium]